MFNYSIYIQYDPRDNIFVANVPELDGCMAHGKTQEQALKEIIIAMRGWLDVAEKVGIEIPKANVL